MGVDVAGGNVFQLIYQLLSELSNWNWLTVAIGVGGILFMIYPKRLFTAMPCALILLVVGMVCSGIWGAQGYGVDVISSIPQGLPPLTLPAFSTDELAGLLPVAVTVALMGYVGTMSICKSGRIPSCSPLTEDAW